MTENNQRMNVVGWLANEDPDMLAMTDRLSFFMFFYELLRKDTGLSADFSGFTIESLLGQPQLLGFRDQYRADPEGVRQSAVAAYEEAPEKVDNGLATMAYVLVKNNSLNFLQDFIHQFDFWQNWQKFHRPSPIRSLNQHDQQLISEHFNR
ncbi:hypothetical protein FC15_GL000437 [Lapidilactobacillus concavus DSM 17758]|uniref:Uncharacterized protein n=1 Tax=Lapidilactobacillus concavus DSM 17758 TaxID=1423735 RepID=A0A0R1W9B4_9LACO|nr:hypothetical protein [Lapidilactobacillus concavus]KRM12452.1 hypothetical protein FC15_GL000437 [Lapidilactobacillus concavus DSM 17758]GEL13286.1 hypothetical protein LCO01nite_08350 [Lapidilactobacillus concavus]